MAASRLTSAVVLITLLVIGGCSSKSVPSAPYSRAGAGKLGLAGPVATALPDWVQACQSVLSPTTHAACASNPASATAICQRLSHEPSLHLVTELAAFPDTQTIELTCTGESTPVEASFEIFTDPRHNEAPPECASHTVTIKCTQGKAGQIKTDNISVYSLINENFQVSVTPTSSGASLDNAAEQALFTAALTEIGVDGRGNYTKH